MEGATLTLVVVNNGGDTASWPLIEFLCAEACVFSWNPHSPWRAPDEETGSDRLSKLVKVSICEGLKWV